MQCIIKPTFSQRNSAGSRFLRFLEPLSQTDTARRLWYADGQKTDAQEWQPASERGEQMATHKEKEQEKLKLLYDIYEQPMYRIAYAILHHTEQAEDAVSDAFLRILKNLKKIGDVRSEKTKHYIISIIRSTAINQYRQNQRDSERYTVWDDRILQVPNQKDDMEQLLANIAQEESIAEMLEPLNDLDRQIVLMRCEEELSFREIAERLSMKEAAARKRFERARKAIQQKKGELYDEIRTQLFSV